MWNDGSTNEIVKNQNVHYSVMSIFDFIVN